MSRRSDAMARLTARGLLALGVLSLAACAAAPAQQPPAAKPGPAPVPKADAPAPVAPVRATPTRPAPVFWNSVRLRNADYVSVRELAENFGLKAAWTKNDTVMTLSDARSVRCTFEGNQKDIYFDGLRIFLGVPALAHKDSLWVSKLDLIKIVAPLFRPEAHAAAFPAAEPKLVVIDPGHGGIDPGTQNTKLGLNEKTLSLDVSQRLAKLLTARGWRVLLVRDRDIELSKDKRTDLLMRNDLANRNQAGLYVSVHFNSAIPSVAGVETYSLAPQFMLSAGDETGDDMTNVAYPGNRLDFANLLLGERMHRAMVAGLKTPDRGYKHARKAVLRMLDCPGVLVECAYLSNDAEARRVATPEFRQQIAEAIATGVGDYAAALAALRPAPTSAK